MVFRAGFPSPGKLLMKGGLRAVPFLLRGTQMSPSFSSVSLMSHQPIPSFWPAHLGLSPISELLLTPSSGLTPNHFPSGEIFLEPICGSSREETRSVSSLSPSPSRVCQELVPSSVHGLGGQRAVVVTVVGSQHPHHPNQDIPFLRPVMAIPEHMILSHSGQ